MLVASELMPAAGERSLRIAGLFAGIGGIEVGFRRAGHRTVLLCEIDPGARNVLKRRLGIEPCSDVRELKSLPGDVDVLTAGFPCQDLSAVGPTSGIRGRKSGLVTHVFRLLGRKPRIPWVVLENVPFMLRLQAGRAMRLITKELEDRGYAWAYRVVDARAFGLPQRRERVLLVASLKEDPRTVLFADDTDANAPERSDPPDWTLAHGFYWTEGNRGLGWAVDAVPPLKGGSGIGIPSAPAIVLPERGESGSARVIVPDIRDAERLQGFDAGWTEGAVEPRLERLRWRMVGNAVPVGAAEWLGRRLANPGDVRDVTSHPFAYREGWPDAAWGSGGKRFAATMSRWPVCWKRQSLSDFLHYAGAPLSAKATKGFRERLERSCLRKPAGFLEILREHEAVAWNAARSRRGNGGSRPDAYQTGADR